MNAPRALWPSGFQGLKGQPLEGTVRRESGSGGEGERGREKRKEEG